MTGREFQDRLLKRAKRVGIAIDPALSSRLEVYFRLLSTWNRRINLSGLDLEQATPEALDRLIVEPLVAARYVASPAKTAIDIGSGGGSPAIPMALAVPTLRLRMVESKTRKSVFLREAVRILDLAAAEVITSRYEQLLSRPDLHEAHDLLTIRAVRIEERVLRSVQAFVKPGGQIFLFRGSVTSDPVDAITPPLAWRGTFPLLDTLQSRLVVVDKRLSGVRGGMFHVKQS